MAAAQAGVLDFPSCLVAWSPILMPYSLLQLLFSHSVVSDSVTPWTAALQASLSFTVSWSLLTLMFIESVMPSNHFILFPPSPPAFSLSPNQGLFKRVSSLHQVAKVLELQLQPQSFQSIFRVNFL